MSSSIDTTAVSFRKGTTTSNAEFIGVLGEVVVDLGYERNGVLGTDINTTLRLHNGVTKGGIALARADMLNITTKVLAENRVGYGDKNLAYNDLLNLVELPEDSVDARNNIRDVLLSYEMVDQFLLNTRLEEKANVSMNNVNTADLATGRIDDKNLAYADTSNINTANLVSDAIHDGTLQGNLPLAYANAQNINTTNLTLDETSRPETMVGPTLATSSLDNVSADTLTKVLFDPVNGLHLEVTTNKDNSIPAEPADAHYPSTQAVKDYAADKDLIETRKVSNCILSSEGEAITIVEALAGQFSQVRLNTGVRVLIADGMYNTYQLKSLDFTTTEEHIIDVLGDDLAAQYLFLAADNTISIHPVATTYFQEDAPTGMTEDVTYKWFDTTANQWKKYHSTETVGDWIEIHEIILAQLAYVVKIPDVGDENFTAPYISVDPETCVFYKYFKIADANTTVSTSLNNIDLTQTDEFLSVGVHTMELLNDIDFILPSPIPGKYNQIKLMLSLPLERSYVLGLGTDRYYDGERPILAGPGYWHVYWDYNPLSKQWVCGAMQETVVG